MKRLLWLTFALSAFAADETPVPTTEPVVTGSIDLGYRWRTDVAGSFDTYRSIINLGEGPKLLGTEFTVIDPTKHLFDRVNVRAYGWGDDPYATLHADAFKAKIYDLRADYRDIAYFNYLPSYADPLLSRGIVLNEQSFDLHRRLANVALDFRPGTWLIPYLAFERDSGSGYGATTFVTNGNEYPVPGTLRDETNLYRGGVRFELRRFHATLEEGGTVFKNDQNEYDAFKNTGNVLTPILGQNLSLNALIAAYGIRGSSAYSKGLFTANPLSWLDLYGQFLFSQPDANVHYQDLAAGTIYAQSLALFYASQQTILTAASKLPHTSGSFGGEVRPFRRMRILENWMTDRLHNSAGAALTQIFATPTNQTLAALNSSLMTNYNQQEIQVLFDVTNQLTLRGGHRYVWGDANSLLPPGYGSTSQGELHRQVALGGLVYRPIKKLTLTGEAEGASSTGAYFATSLYDYQKARAQARYQVLNSLNVAVDFTMLNNQNPTSSVNFDSKSNQETLSLFWSPKGGKRFDLEGSYGHSYFRSTIGYLAPQDLSAQTSIYTDNSHTATALANLNLPGISGRAAKITAGGSFVRSSGSRPTSYYQPLAKAMLPVAKNVSFFGEWRYYGYGEAFYLYEGFRTHLITAGVRFSR